MKLAGTKDTGWVPIDLADVARAIATLRSSATALRARAERAAQDAQRSERLVGSGR